jgi:ferredoxin
MANIIFLVIGFLKFSFFIFFSIISYREREMIAFKRSLVLSIISPIPFVFAAVLLPFEVASVLLFIVGMLVIFFIIACFIPFKRLKEVSENSNFRIDERTTMFSRNEITHFPQRSDSYYKHYPEHKTRDEKWHTKPGLLGDNSSMYKAKEFAAAGASFSVIEKLRHLVSPDPAEKQYIGCQKEFTVFVKNWAKKLGAVDIGICELKPNHFYSHRGRGDAYGEEVKMTHRFGIAITVEMNQEYLASGPAAPTVMESAQQYLNSGTIALQITNFIANLGYSARAHIDGNYEVVCPLVARDAGLGEIGRMGLLMTPKLGPRVRVAVITTNLPLEIDSRKYDATVHDFCSICKKCANVCPSQAIPYGPREMINDTLRWQINQEKCFSLWCTVGTDCGRCMSVCPYAHPNNVLHNWVRWGIKHSWLFCRIAIWMDDFFYGKKPKPKKLEL